MSRARSSERARAIALLVLALAAPLRGEESDPNRIPRARFRAEVARLALQPLQLPAGTPDSERVRNEFEGLIAAELQRRGYAVAPSSVFRESWLRFATDLGDVFDPVTGQPDPKKYALAWQYTARELERSHHVDAVVTSAIAFDAMPVSPGFLSLNAAGQPLRWRGGKLVAFPSGQPQGRPQRVEGAYLGVRIRDRAQALLYDLRLPLAWARVYLAGDYEERPPDQLYADREHNRETVEALLSQLVDRNAKSGGS